MGAEHGEGAGQPRPDEGKAGLPSHISAFGEPSDAGFGSPAAVAIAACLPDHLFSVDGKADDGGDYSGAVHEQHATGGGLMPYNEDAEGEWAAVAVANAGLADGDGGRPACRVPRESAGPASAACPAATPSLRLRQCQCRLCADSSCLWRALPRQPAYV